MARNERRSRGGRKKTGGTLGYLLSAFSILAIAGIVGGGIYFIANKRPVDSVTQCPTDHLDSIAAVVIDLTDPITKVQSLALENTLARLRDDLPKYGRLDLYTIVDATGTSRDPIFSMCNPGSGAQVADPLTGNKELADRLWKKRFGDKLAEAFDQATRVTPMEASPIFEAIHFAAVRSFGRPDSVGAKSKTLVIISDLIHNFRDVNMYRATPRFSEFRRTPYYLSVAPRLREVLPNNTAIQVDIVAHVIFRQTNRNVQTPNAFRDFWEDYVREAGGVFRVWNPVQ